jgi:hypothetical protein
MVASPQPTDCSYSSCADAACSIYTHTALFYFPYVACHPYFYWECAPPPINSTYKSTHFPSRYQQSHLFSSALSPVDVHSVFLCLFHPCKLGLRLCAMLHSYLLLHPSLILLGTSHVSPVVHIPVRNRSAFLSRPRICTNLIFILFHDSIYSHWRCLPIPPPICCASSIFLSHNVFSLLIKFIRVCKVRLCSPIIINNLIVICFLCILHRCNMCLCGTTSVLYICMCQSSIYRLFCCCPSILLLIPWSRLSSRVAMVNTTLHPAINNVPHSTGNTSLILNRY